MLGIAPIAIELCSGALNGLDTIQSLAPVMKSAATDSGVSDAANLTPEWFAWAPELNPTAAGILKTAPVACLSFLLLSPINVCRKVAAAKSVGSLKSAPFFAVTNACVAWLAFGIQLQDLVIILPNAMGLGLSAYYLHTYANNCKDPSALRPSFLGSGLLAAGVTGAVVAFPEQSVTYIGYLASALAVWLSVSPLTALKTVVQEKSTAALPLGISVGVVLNNASWVAYGLCVAHNPFLVFPNGLGLTAGLLQLSMFGFYGLPPPLPRKKD